MGNGSSSVCHVTNHGQRAVRVVITQHCLVIDDVLTARAKVDGDGSSVGKKFSFREDVHCVRILPSHSKTVKFEPREHMNIFVEDEEDYDVCCKHVMHNRVMIAPFTVLLYDV